MRAISNKESTFGAIELGQDFFDPFSGEDFKKTSSHTAKDSRTDEEAAFDPEEAVVL